MGSKIRLQAADGHALDAWEARPEGEPRGGLVIIQEIFGVTGHIRAVTDRFATAGFHAVAPAMFDRIRSDIELDYTDIPGGRALVQQLKPAETMADVAAAIAAVADSGRTAVVGYCWGGTVAYLAAGALPISAAVAYYGGMIGNFLDRKPKVPVLYHFGERDQHIPMDVVARIRAAHPEGEYHTYPAGHGFNCDERADYDPASATAAFERTIAFLERELGA